MSEELVAELTLRLQNQMTAEIDAIKTQFATLDGTIQQLTGVLGDLATVLANLQAPVALEQGMLAVANEAHDAVAAVSAIGDAAAADITQIDALGQAISSSLVADADQVTAALKADAAQIEAIKAAVAQPTPAFLPPGTVGPDGSTAPYGTDPNMPAFIPPETPRPAPPPAPPPAPQPPKADNEDHPIVLGGRNMLSDAFFGLLGADMAEHMAKGFADYDWTLTHIAITEKLSGPAAQQEKDYIGAQLQQLALQTGNSSTDLADAYYFLVTTGMDRKLIQQFMPVLAETSTAYNVPVTEQMQSLFTLNHVFGLDPEDMESGLGMLAYAAKNNHFSLADFGQYLPDIGSQFELLGARGLKGVDVAAAALETIRGETGDSATADADLRELLSYIVSPMATRYFDKTSRSEDLLGKPTLRLMEKYHIPKVDVPEYLDEEEAKGIDPLSAMIDLAHSMIRPGETPSDQAEIFHALFHGLQSGDAALYLIQHYDQFKSIKDTLAGVNPAIVRTDYQTASDAPEFTMRQFDEDIIQLSRQIGGDLIPTFEVLDWTLMNFGAGLKEIQALWDVGTKPLTTALGTTAAYAGHEIDQYPGGAERSRFGFNVPMQLHVTVSHAGNVTVTPANVPPGVSVKINQGPVLNAP